MEKSITKLNYSDVVYGIIHIKGLRHLPSKGELFEIKCVENGEKKSVKIPKNCSYISGLTEFHRRNNAIVGTEVSITKIGEKKYEIEYNSINGKSVSKEKGEEKLAPITQIIYKIQSRPWMFDEATVRSEIIDPVLNMAGWVFPDVAREVVVRTKNKEQKKADYILYSNNHPCFIIEAKKLLNNLEDKEDIKQLNDYWKSNNIIDIKNVIGIFCNGQEWQIWDNVNRIACISIYDAEAFYNFIVKVLCCKNLDLKTIKNRLKETKANNTPLSKKNNAALCQEYEAMDFARFVSQNYETFLDMINNGLISKLIIASNKTEIKEKRGACNKDYTKRIHKNIWKYTYLSPYEEQLLMMQVIQSKETITEKYIK